jgi:chemotaxis protein methyltransferase CheR
MDPTKISDNEFECMKEYIEKNCGILLTNQKAYLVESRLTHILIESGCQNYRDLYLKAKMDTSFKLRNKIIDAMTTNETLWFRDQAPFDFLAKTILKNYLKELVGQTRQKIRIWSAACSTGQEPYSIAMIIQEFARLNPSFPIESVEIIATDISPTALFLANAARYDQIAISRGLPDDIKNRYFSQDQKTWKLNDPVKKMVKLQKLNLQDSFTSLGMFDIIFCRNVAIYFSDAFKSDLFTRIAKALTTNGYFFVGASESLSFYSNLFKMYTSDRVVYYQVKKPGDIV